MLALRRTALSLRSLVVGLRPRRACAWAAVGVTQCATGGARALAMLVALGCGGPSIQHQLALCLQLQEPPKLSERAVGKDDRINIVLVGKTGHGKSSIANILCGIKNKFKVSVRRLRLEPFGEQICSSRVRTPAQDDLSSVTSEIQYADFEYKGQKVRVIDTPGFFDTSMPPEEIQQSLNQFGDVAREGITALLVVVKKERFTAENAAVCEFVHCVLGDGALEKYGAMVLTHSGNDTADCLKSMLRALPAENYGARLLQLVQGRLLSVESTNWRQSRIRDTVLKAALEMRERNGFQACDPQMMQWARIKHLETSKFEEDMRPHLATLQAAHDESRRAMQDEREEREAAFAAQLLELQRRLDASRDADEISGARQEIEAREAEHRQQVRALEAQLNELERAHAGRQALRQEVDAAAFERRPGDLDLIKQVAHQQQVRGLDSKMRSEWMQRTGGFGASNKSACAIQ